MTKDEALDLALEALGQLWLFGDEAAVIANPAITAIKQARSAPVQEPYKSMSEHIAQATSGRVCIDPITGDVGIGTPAAQPAPVQEPKMYEDWYDSASCGHCGMVNGHTQHCRTVTRTAATKISKHEPVIFPAHGEAITSLRQAIEQAEKQEPVAFNAGVPPLYPEMKDGETISVEYTTPPAAQRQWVGLTTDEMKEVADRYHLKPPNVPVAFRAIEAKLKEKNNGQR